MLTHCFLSMRCRRAPEALNFMRYFYEEKQEIPVIAAGSLMEVMIRKAGLRVPVGRVEYAYLYPLSFSEFLLASNKKELLELRAQHSPELALPKLIHEQLMKAFLEYAFIGGMPEAVTAFVEGASYRDLRGILESLMVGFIDDVSKYASDAQSVYVRYVLENAPRSVGMQLSYNNFADSNYRSREISLAFDLLEAAHLLKRVYSSRSVAIPLVPNKRKHPKLLFLDHGLVNYHLGLREKFSSFKQLENVFQGQLTEQLVGSALLNRDDITSPLCYWYRDKRGASAEVDYIFQGSKGLIPIEVKSASGGWLKSLHSLVDETACTDAIRFWGLNFGMEEHTTLKGNKFRLANVPIYCADSKDLVAWVEKKLSSVGS